jgi:hypothetical protein
VSYWFDLAAGASMVLVAVAIFFVVFLYASWRDGRPRPSQLRSATPPLEEAHG